MKSKKYQCCSPDLKELANLSVFCDDYKPKHALVVCQASRKRIVKDKNGSPIEILPWQAFLEQLWDNAYKN